MTVYFTCDPSESFLNVISVLEAVKYERFLSGEVLLNFNSMNVKLFLMKFLPLKIVPKLPKRSVAILKRIKRGFLVTIKDVKARLQIQRKIVQRNIGFRNLKSGSTYEISVRALKESIQTT